MWPRYRSTGKPARRAAEVDALADDWGTRLTEAGKAVWFTPSLAVNLAGTEIPRSAVMPASG
jgi:hypothetical protein